MYAKAAGKDGKNRKEGRKGQQRIFLTQWVEILKSFLKVRKFQKQTFFAFNSSNFSLISALASKMGQFKKISTHIILIPFHLHLSFSFDPF